MNYFILIENKLDYFRILILAHKMGFSFKTNQLINENEFSPSIYLENNYIVFKNNIAIKYTNIHSSDFIKKYDTSFFDITVPSLSFYLKKFNNQIIMNNFKFTTFKKDPISFNILSFPNCLSLRSDYLLDVILNDIENSVFIFKVIHIVELVNTIIIYLNNFDIEKLKSLYIENRDTLLLDFFYHQKQIQKKYSISYFKLLLDKLITDFFYKHYSLSHHIEHINFSYKKPLLPFFKQSIPTLNHIYLLNQIP